jgi:hypothetical protein
MIDLHGALVLTHVAAMIGLFSTLTIEGLAVRFLRRAVTHEQAREWTALWDLLPAVGAPSILLALASGIYLATLLGLWDFRWAQVAVPTLVIVAIAGGVTAPARNRVRAAVGASSGPLPADLRQRIRHPLLPTSWRLRTVLLSGLVVDMMVKPDHAVLLMVTMGLIGAAWSIPLWTRSYGALEFP